MGTKLGEKRIYFPRVREAREVLRERAVDLLAKYELIIDQAIKDGKLEVAAEHVQWLLEHTAAEDGERIIDPSAAKPKEIQGSTGPTIQIGIALGTDKPKTIGPQVIEAEVLKHE